MEKKQKKVHFEAIVIGVATALTVAAIGFGIGKAQIFYQDKIFPLVSIESVRVGGLTKSEAKTEVTSFADTALKTQRATVTFEGKTATITPEVAGYSKDIDTAIDQAYSFVREGNLTPLIRLGSTIDPEKVKIALQKEFPNVEKNPVDAKFYLTDKNELAIKDEELGKSYNVTTVASNLKWAFDTNSKSLVTVSMKTTQPILTKEVLTGVESDAKAFINYAPVLVANNKKYTPTIADRFSFLDVVVNEGEPEVIANEEKIKAYVQAINKKATIKAQPDIFYTSGELSSEGKDGVTIDEAAATTAIKDLYLAKNSKTITLATTTLQKDKKVIDKPFTPGMFPGKYIEVDLSTQQLFQFEGENLVTTRRVSTGKWSTPTPIGTFYINNKVPRAYSRAYKLYMPYWMAFLGHEYGLHELPEWPDGRKEGQSHIGTPVSHGCIRLGVGEAEQVYNWAEIGTPVVVHK